jgi:hemoglobin
MKKDITTIEDIKLLVDQFYGKIQKDDLLGPIFEARIDNNWSKHLSIMYSFWQTILLPLPPGEATYRGAPFAPHATLPINSIHFDRWLILFKETVDENFAGEIAEEAKSRGVMMAGVFQFKLSQIR